TELMATTGADRSRDLAQAEAGHADLAVGLVAVLGLRRPQALEEVDDDQGRAAGGLRDLGGPVHVCRGVQAAKAPSGGPCCGSAPDTSHCLSRTSWIGEVLAASAIRRETDGTGNWRPPDASSLEWSGPVHRLTQGTG